MLIKNLITYISFKIFNKKKPNKLNLIYIYIDLLAK